MSNAAMTVNAYKATVIATFIQGGVEFTTYIGARNAEDAKRLLEREGYDVMHLWVLEV